ncbi:MAG: hypothetical protein KF791_02345 [Verrucomicrobiae bacterium]|nr:hypothetical protein [Verrucomicrobiae bacterium]
MLNGNDGSPQLWDATELRPISASVLDFSKTAYFNAVSPDGRRILTGNIHRARLWDAESGLPLGGCIGPTPGLRRTDLSPDERYGLSADENASIRVWPVLIAPLPAPAWLPELAEAVAGHRLRADGLQESAPLERWPAVSATLAAFPGNEFHARWARWFFVERLQPHPAEFGP